MAMAPIRAAARPHTVLAGSSTKFTGDGWVGWSSSLIHLSHLGAFCSALPYDSAGSTGRAPGLARRRTSRKGGPERHQTLEAAHATVQPLTRSQNRYLDGFRVRRNGALTRC